MEPCESAFFPEFSFTEPSVGKSPEVSENPSFLGGVTPCIKVKTEIDYIKLSNPKCCKQHIDGDF